MTVHFHFPAQVAAGPDQAVRRQIFSSPILLAAGASPALESPRSSSNWRFQMQHHRQPMLTQAQPSSQPTVAPLRTLSAEEMREIVGGPIINNGGAIATQSASNSKG